MLYKWNHTVCNLLDWFLFPPQHDSWEIFLVSVYINSSFLLLLGSISCYGCIMLCLKIYLLEDNWVDSSLGPWWRRCLNVCVQIIWIDIIFHFSGINAQDSLLGHMVIAFLVLWETAKLFFRLAVPLSIPTSNVNDLASAYSQVHFVLSLFFILAILRVCSDSSLQSFFLLPILLWCRHQSYVSKGYTA